MRNTIGYKFTKDIGISDKAPIIIEDKKGDLSLKIFTDTISEKSLDAVIETLLTFRKLCGKDGGYRKGASGNYREGKDLIWNWAYHNINENHTITPTLMFDRAIFTIPDIHQVNECIARFIDDEKDRKFNKKGCQIDDEGNVIYYYDDEYDNRGT